MSDDVSHSLESQLGSLMSPLCIPGCDTDTVAGVHCLPTPRQEAASKLAFLVLGMALALLLTVSGLGVFYLRLTHCVCS